MLSKSYNRLFEVTKKLLGSKMPDYHLPDNLVCLSCLQTKPLHEFDNRDQGLICARCAGRNDPMPLRLEPMCKCGMPAEPGSRFCLKCQIEAKERKQELNRIRARNHYWRKKQAKEVMNHG